MLKIGVLGAGHLGKIHIKCIKEIKEYELVGFYDLDQQNAQKVEEELGVKSFPSLHDLIEIVDVVDIVTPTVSHYSCAIEALQKNKHAFIEKPITTTLDEAAKLIEESKIRNLKVQIGHVERFNPAFMGAAPFIKNPMFIETHRLSTFNPRGTDVPVVLDLMIHDIDILLSVVKSKVSNVSASGVSIICDTPDIANARIEFENGCVANLTASRISMKSMRKSRFFQRDAYIAVDFLNKKTEIIRMNEVSEQVDDPYALILDLGKGKPKKQIFIESPEIQSINAIKTELESFYSAIVNNATPPVTIEDGYHSLELAYLIISKFRTE